MSRLIVLADTWGMHPSSCQHLVRRLAARHPTLWVNTIGMRRPRVSGDDASKIAAQLGRWIVPHRARAEPRVPPAALTVSDPVMWPGFHHTWERQLNARLLRRALRRWIAASADGGANRRAVVLTTLPIAGALTDHLEVDAWVYYCVDDFSAWPGLDGEVMRELEERLIARADRIVAASHALQTRIAADGREAVLLTHGVDLAHWRAADGSPRAAAPLPWMQALPRPVVLFWGLIDARLDVAWLRALGASLGSAGSIVLIGPLQAPDPELTRLPGIRLPGRIPYDELPRAAAAADALVMPYRDTAATRAMQPLKLTEYLATDKPVIMRNLPGVAEWRDAADVVACADSFVRMVNERVRGGLPAAQRQARSRLISESWDSKAEILATILREA